MDIETLTQQADDLKWSLFIRRKEGERIERIYWRAYRRWERRALILEDYYRYRGMP